MQPCSALRVQACNRSVAARRACVSKPVAPVRRQLIVTAAHKQSFKSFDDMIANSELPVLVDFYATWCGPCQMLAKTLGDVADKMKGKVMVVKIDTDKYPNIASTHRIQALPTLVLFKGGKPVDRIEGLLTEQQLLDRLKYYLQSSS